MHLLVQEVSQKHDGEIEKEVEEQVTIEKRTSHDLQVRNTSQNDENYVVSEDRNYDEDYNWLKRKCDSLWAAFIINGKKVSFNFSYFEFIKDAVLKARFLDNIWRNCSLFMLE